MAINFPISDSAKIAFFHARFGRCIIFIILSGAVQSQGFDQHSTNKESVGLFILMKVVKFAFESRKPK